ncbi:MAG: hypothetical protein WKF58_16565 [Ilumatobacteraceae bacterium]
MPEPGETHLSDEVDADADGEIDAEVVERPWWGVLTLVAFGGLVVCTNIANAVWVEWINDDPERVIALSSRNRFLALAVGADVSPVAFVVISALRLGLAFTVCHMVGRAYRQDAYRFFVRFLGLSRQNVDQMEDGFAKAQWVLIPFFIGSNIVAVISGVERTRGDASSCSSSSGSPGGWRSSGGWRTPSRINSTTCSISSPSTSGGS